MSPKVQLNWVKWFHARFYDSSAGFQGWNCILFHQPLFSGQAVQKSKLPISHCTVVHFVIWPLSGSEAKVDCFWLQNPNEFINTEFLASFSSTCRSSFPLLCHLYSCLTLIVINTSRTKRQLTYLFSYSFALRVQGPQIWNDIPLPLRNTLTISNYRQKLRDYFQSLWIHVLLSYTRLSLI